MPGILGYVRDLNTDEGRAYLAAMARALEPDQRLFVKEAFNDSHGGLGSISLSNAATARQTMGGESRQVRLAVEGEVFNSEELHALLKEKGQYCAQDSPAGLLLSLYLCFGDEFAAYVNGAFVAAIWDSEAREMTLVNDHLGLYPLYYSTVNGDLLFASGIRALLSDSRLSRQTDQLAIAQFLTFDHILDDRTLLSSVRLLPQASVLKFSRSQGLRMHHYWVLHYQDTFDLRPEAAYREELTSLLQQAVKRQVPRNGAPGILLSGGLDSRALLAHLKLTGSLQDSHSFTWGIPGCDDARTAQELARLAGTQHHFCELQPDYLLRTAEEAVRITDGNGNIVNLHALTIADTASKFVGTVFKGFLGDAMMGFALQRPFWADYSPAVSTRVHQHVHSTQGVLNYDREALRGLLLETVDQEVGDAVFETYQDGLQRSGNQQLASQRLYFDYTQRVPRMTLNGVEVVRSRVKVHLPFVDRDLVAFALRVPPGFHFERHLMRSAFIHAFPEFAKIPVPDTGLPMISCARDLRLRAGQLVRWHLNRLNVSWLSRPTRRPYKDYALWFRTVLRPWLEERLLQDGFLERGYFKPDQVRAMVSEHMNGKNLAVRLGALLSLEIWHRRFVD